MTKYHAFKGVLTWHLGYLVFNVIPCNSVIISDSKEIDPITGYAENENDHIFAEM